MLNCVCVCVCVCSFTCSVIGRMSDFNHRIDSLSGYENWRGLKEEEVGEEGGEEEGEGGEGCNRFIINSPAAIPTYLNSLIGDWR